MLSWNHEDLLVLTNPLTQHYRACFTQHRHTPAAPAQWFHTTPNHRCGSLAFDVSLRRLQGKTSWMARKRKERKITFSLYTGGKKVQHCTDPKSPPVPDFPQDHLKSLTNPESSEKTQGFSLMDNALAMCSSGSASLRAGNVRTVFMWPSPDRS